MKTIWKYQLYYGPNNVAVAKGAKVLGVVEQSNAIQLYVLTDPDAVADTLLELAVVYTGRYCDDNTGEYVGTVKLDGGSRIAHVFKL